MELNILYQEQIDSIITNLALLSLVQKNEKLCIRKGHLQIDKESTFRFLKRYYYGDSRDATIIFLRELVHKLILIKKDSVKEYVDIHSIELGINNLKISYSDDLYMRACLDNLLYKLKILFVTPII